MKKHLQNCLCVIPARGGSKRIPRKNVVDFAELVYVFTYLAQRI